MALFDRWPMVITILVALVLAGCGLGTLHTSPTGPGHGNIPNTPKQSSAFVSLQLIDLPDVESVKVTMVLYMEGSIVSVPVRSADLTIDHSQALATGEVMYLQAGHWDLTVTASMSFGPERKAVQRVFVDGGEKIILQGTLAPDPNNAARLLLNLL